jgi:hypothetical protein
VRRQGGAWGRRAASRGADGAWPLHAGLARAAARLYAGARRAPPPLPLAPPSPPARYWTEAFARDSGDHAAKVARVTEMGFGRADAERALAAAGGDENAALEALLGAG